MRLHKLWAEIKYWSQILLIPLYGLSHLMPRNKNTWVFGSTFGKRFADNPKYFYLYVTQHHQDEIKAIWISKDRAIIDMLRKQGYRSYYLYSLLGVWYSLRAKVYFYDNYSKDICFTLSGRAVKINMWHGIPLKKIQWDNIFDKVRHPKSKLEKIRWALRRMSDEKPSDYVLTTSQFLKPIFSSAFCTDRVLICGYPRNDILISDMITEVQSAEEKSLVNTMVQAKETKKIVLYMPTFRDSEKKFFEVIQLKEFHSFLEKENILFCVKLHVKSKLRERFMEIQKGNILIIDPNADPYPLLKISDVLITDYSSVYFDFLLTSKPIIFFAYDLQDYLRESREMYFDYHQFTPGEKVYNQKELETVLSHIDSQQYRQEREKLCNQVFLDCSHPASVRLYHHITELTGIKH